ncbi:MAG: hypothetical protein JRI64_00810 [Deltaproteobacteria bacterium]|nr:hypothetical protein [Deltaproteobacteria bacterium]
MTLVNKVPQAAPIRSAEKERVAAMLSLPLRYSATGNWKPQASDTAKPNDR